MVDFIFGVFFGYIFGFGTFTVVDKLDRQLKAQNAERQE